MKNEITFFLAFLEFIQGIARGRMLKPKMKLLCENSQRDD